MRIKDVLGYEGLYAVSDHGHVFGLYRTWRGPSGELKWSPSRLLEGSVSAKGYHRVTLSNDDGERWASVHRLVAQAFCEPYEGETVNHIDGNRLNNHYSNLEWCPGEVNLIHEHLRKKRVFLTATQIMELLRLSETVPSALLCERFNVSQTVVSKLLRDYRARRQQ